MHTKTPPFQPPVHFEKHLITSIDDADDNDGTENQPNQSEEQWFLIWKWFNFLFSSNSICHLPFLFWLNVFVFDSVFSSVASVCLCVHFNIFLDIECIILLFICFLPHKVYWKFSGKFSAQKKQFRFSSFLFAVLQQKNPYFFCCLFFFITAITIATIIFNCFCFCILKIIVEK